MRHLSMLLVFALLLTGCGGDVTIAKPGTFNAAQGVYFSGFYKQDVTAIVLPDGRFFAPLPSGVAVGQSTASSNVIIGTYRNFSGANTQSGTIDGTFVLGSTLDATLSENGNPLPVHGIAVPDIYSLATPASLAGFSARYLATMDVSCNLIVTVSGTDGTLLAQPANAVPSCSCAFSGKFSPDANLNFYNVTVNFPANGCAFQNQTVTGIAVFYKYRLLDYSTLPAFAVVFSTPDSAALMTGLQSPGP